MYNLQVLHLSFVYVFTIEMYFDQIDSIEVRLTFRRVIIEKWMYTAQVSINNALILGNLCEYRHK